MSADGKREMMAGTHARTALVHTRSLTSLWKASFSLVIVSEHPVHVVLKSCWRYPVALESTRPRSVQRLLSKQEAILTNVGIRETLRAYYFSVSQ